MADGQYECPGCNGDCGTADCVKFVTQECVDGIQLCESEICTALYSCPDPDDPTKPLFQPTDWTIEADWKAAIDNGDVCKINVIGDMPAPEQETLTLSKRRKKVGKKKFSLNLDIDEFSEANYEAMRKWECGASVFLWFQTIDGGLYGGENGIYLDITEANSPLTRGEGQYKKILLKAEWERSCHPPMTMEVPSL